ncbi:SusC/RagA family TonB-linked outer membrane protein [Parachryseolinea silvisoli]|uniref:SusC/RagA family TonB-linked outer membrane protein n=1 Tax=Parachryseolinea silvisoli TaxID=2873601 RepID=UPI002265BDEC|nr:SusC/RagA family TonB-linked outer membrane protein [Parachryseolinea silvisoli]MCD9015447.1 SusC/RagA family TonB-linked outer membrane protein [Parachryseolinea silvisoli]
MKQNFTYKGLARLYFIMRVLAVYLILLAFLGMPMLKANPVHGQSTENTFVNIKAQHVPLQSVFSMLENETGFMFVFPVELVAKYGDVSVDGGRQSVSALLHSVLDGSQLAYRESGKNIIVFEVPGVQQSQVELKTPYSFVPVEGRVIDSEGSPMPGVNVVVKGTTIGTSTDGQGAFAIEVPEGKDALIFSFIGFRTIELALNGKTDLSVQMESDITTLDAVDVVGYYSTTERLKTGSIVKVGSEEIERQPVTSPLLALQAKVPGLDITPTTGVPGSSVRIQIRGRNSLRNNSQGEVANSPLYVIDGVPIDPSPVRSGSQTTSTVFFGYDPLSSISPANIESIQILKDADATAIYGSRGANGVILITTKQGKIADKGSVDLGYYSGVGQIANRIDVLNTKQYLAMRREALRNDGIPEPAWYEYDVNGTWDSTRNTNWQKELLGGTAKIHDVQVGFSSGSATTSFRLAGSFHKETSVYSDDFGSTLLSGNLSLNHRSANGRFRGSVSINYGLNKNKTFESSQFITQALTLPPNAPELYRPDGSLNWQIIEAFGAPRSSFDNPLAALQNTTKLDQGNFISNFNLSYDIVRGLSFKTNLGYTDLNASEIIRQPIAAQPPTNINGDVTGAATFGTTRRRSWIVEPQFDYNADFDGHHISVLLGGTWQETLSDYTSIYAFGYTSDVLLDGLQAAQYTSVNADNSNRVKFGSGYFRLTYNWKERYIATFTGRRDGSSRFGPGRRWGNFGAVGLAWIFSNESFINDKSILSLGKIRANFGTTGNDQIGDYRYLDLYNISQYRYQNSVTLVPTSLFNPNFSWEKTNKFEAALELGLFDDRIFFEFDWYRNRSSSQLIDYKLPAITGFSSVFKNFNAEVENSGVEAIIQIRQISTAKFSWATSINISRNWNRLLSFPGLKESSYARQYRVGESLSLQELYSYTGVDPVTGLYTVKDFNDDGEFNDEDYKLSNPTDRIFYGGITNDLRFGSLSISFTFQFSRQFLAGYAPGGPAGIRNLNMPVEALDRWEKEGNVSPNQKFSQSFEAQIARALFVGSDGNIENASFLRLKTASISYDLPARWFDDTYFSQARVYLQGQNLLTFTKYGGLDPETQVALPPLRIISIGFNVRF